MAARKSSRATSSKMKMNSLQMISWLLVTIGAINWGLVGLANINLVEALLGSWPALVQIVYILVGLSGLYSLWGMFTMGK
jgi:uncharacterized membrane protein YuzA (DUF378 family)